MAELLEPPKRRVPGVPLKAAGGLPRPTSQVSLSSKLVPTATPTRVQDGQSLGLDQRFTELSPSLAAILRPQAAYRWVLPYLAAITPTYVESTLRGALAGNHVQSWELFDLMIDSNPELSACVQEYVDGVMGHKLIFEPYHEEDEEPTPSALEKCKLVSAAVRGMMPDRANDENGIRGTMRDILFARFHGQSVVEVDWSKGYGENALNVKEHVPGLDGRAVFPRSTYWVHPVCYAYSTEGRLGLRATLGELANAGRRFSPQYQLDKDGAKSGWLDRMSYVEPPAWNYIASQARPSDLIQFPKNKFIVSFFKKKSGTALGGSCLRELAAWWVFANFSGDYLMNYAQLFGIPFRSATYAPNTSEATKAEIRQMLQSMGSSAYGLFPQGVEVEFEQASSGAGQSPQAFLVHLCDSYMRKVVLHQTMTGSQHDSMGKGGGKAFGEVEDDTKQACIGAGARFVEEQINLQLVPDILEINYPDATWEYEKPECKLVESAVGGLPDAQRDQVLAQLMNVPAGYLRRKYGVPKPGADDEVAGVDQGVQGATAAQAQANVEADRAQADKHAKMQSDATVKQAKMHADALAKQPAATGPQPGQTPKQAGQQEKQPGSDDNESVDARRRLEAKAAGDGYGCLMAMIPNYSLSISEFQTWSREKIEAGTLAGDGIETEPHVTVYYGFNLGFDTGKLVDLIDDKNSFVIKLGKVSRFECPDYDVLKVDVESPELDRLHKAIDGKLAADVTPSQHAYHPHLTLAYVAKGSNKNLDGSDAFEGKIFTVNSLVYREPNHTNEQAVPLDARRAPVRFQAADAGDVAAALHDTVEPLLDRIKAIAAVKDDATRVKLTKKLLKDLPHLTHALAQDDSVAKAMAPDVIKRFLQRLKAESDKPKGKTT